MTPRALIRLRKRLGSREALADRIGVSAQTVWRWEHGDRIPEPEQRLLRQVESDHV